MEGRPQPTPRASSGRRRPVAGAGRGIDGRRTRTSVVVHLRAGDGDRPSGRRSGKELLRETRPRRTERWSMEYGPRSGSSVGGRC
ncbi:putative serine/arginine-rich splicing factor SR45 isoform X1 [Iris pallida]|uniref:Serine/arginine-rich splicing factor SR45 isoform X1 n=1 Tax=Iris pallida TaxID=29817 RepID=A0AAX6GU29_IRIPA|nr:putative serine/arginine-rich splicing factor SR45 isoform X1 [Iris pallida]